MTSPELRYDGDFKSGLFWAGECYRTWVKLGSERLTLLVTRELLEALGEGEPVGQTIDRFSPAFLRVSERVIFDGNTEEGDGHRSIMLRQSHAEEVRSHA